MLAAREPSPCAWYFSGLGLLIDLVVKALAPVMPERAAAAHYGDSMVTMLSGFDDATGKRFLDIEPHIGGWGAWEGSDGESGLINSVNGSVKDLPIEVQESKFPMRITRYELRADSGGPGKWRGGCGVIREYTIDCDHALLGVWFERSRTPAWGLLGGGDGEPPDVVINPGRSDERHVLKDQTRLSRGDVVRCHTGGGGGFGDPRQRGADDIRADLRDRFATPERVQRDYGVNSKLERS
jgi:N-methylhydantoinase B